MADNIRPGETTTEMQPLVSIIMGSKSDWPVMKEASLILEELGIPYEKKMVSETVSWKNSNCTQGGFPVAPFFRVTNPEELTAGMTEIGYPGVLKTVRGGYDGKGQLVINNHRELDKACALVKAGDNEWILEKMISFTCEVSVIVARTETGETAAYPVAENIHRENILHMTVVPARISPQEEAASIEIAREIAHFFQIVGLLTVEFFVTPSGLLVNEIAPAAPQFRTLHPGCLLYLPV